MLLALRREELGSITWNDVILRRTMRLGPARLGTPVLVAELCLGHKQGGVIGIYDRHTYLDERRVALLKWEQLVMGLVDPASKSCRCGPDLPLLV